MVLETFNQEDYEKDILAEGFAEGEKSGKTAERENGIQILIETLKELDSSKERILQKIIEKYKLSPEQAEEYLQKLWTES